MVAIEFDDPETEKRAVDFLNGRFTFKISESGELILSESALGPLAAYGISFKAKGTEKTPVRERPVGQTLPGQIKVPDEVFAPLTPEELKLWGL